VLELLFHIAQIPGWFIGNPGILKHVLGTTILKSTPYVPKADWDAEFTMYLL